MSLGRTLHSPLQRKMSLKDSKSLESNTITAVCFGNLFSPTQSYFPSLNGYVVRCGRGPRKAIDVTPAEALENLDINSDQAIFRPYENTLDPAIAAPDQDRPTDLKWTKSPRQNPRPSILDWILYRIPVQLN
ncbi:hypothetical protein N7488_003884 [Penicillium malachiteum]|nr:hypothetical protein N7488_003884 [Penicillium malachiteum]